MIELSEYHHGFIAGYLPGLLMGLFLMKMAWDHEDRQRRRRQRPEQPLAADLIRYSRWRDEQIRRAATEPIRFDEGRVQRGNGNCVPMPPGTPAPGHRRVYYDMPSTIAECGGPCSFGGPELCDCGALWRDVPIKPQFPSPRKIREDFLP